MLCIHIRTELPRRDRVFWHCKAIKDIKGVYKRCTQENGKVTEAFNAHYGQYTLEKSRILLNPFPKIVNLLSYVIQKVRIDELNS